MSEINMDDDGDDNLYIVTQYTFIEFSDGHLDYLRYLVVTIFWTSAACVVNGDF